MPVAIDFAQGLGNARAEHRRIGVLHFNGISVISRFCDSSSALSSSKCHVRGGSGKLNGEGSCPSLISINTMSMRLPSLKLARCAGQWPHADFATLRKIILRCVHRSAQNDNYRARVATYAVSGSHVLRHFIDQRLHHRREQFAGRVRRDLFINRHVVVSRLVPGKVCRHRVALHAMPFIWSRI